MRHYAMQHYAMQHHAEKEESTFNVFGPTSRLSFEYSPKHNSF